MASGTGTFTSDSYYSVTAATGVKCTAVVSQSVNANTRKASITVRCMMTFYRISSTWSLSAGTDIAYNASTSYFVRAIIDGDTEIKTKLGIEAARAFTAQPGTNYTQAGGYIQSMSGYNSEVTKTKTYDFNSSGDPITRAWSASVYYGGTTLTVSGSVTTDGLQSQSKLYGSVNNQSERITKLYCSVNGQSKLVKKLYASVNGQSKLIWG